MAENTNANWADVDVKLWPSYIYPHNVNQSFTSNMIYKCYAFNYNCVCNKQNCTYSHCCIRCFCAHPLMSCARQSNTRLEFNRPRPQFQLGRARSQLRLLTPQSNAHQFNFRYPETVTRTRPQGQVVAQRQYSN